MLIEIDRLELEKLVWWLKKTEYMCQQKTLNPVFDRKDIEPLESIKRKLNILKLAAEVHDREVEHLMGALQSKLKTISEKSNLDKNTKQLQLNIL